MTGAERTSPSDGVDGGGPAHAGRRRELILAALRAHGQVRALDLATELGVTHETVRKDLVALEARGLLQRVHGGALPTQARSFEPAVSTRTTFAREKQRIAAAAARFVPAQGAVLLDAGSTTHALAESFPASRDLTVVTNTLPIALSLLGYPDLTVHTLGGRVRPTTMAEVDHWALRTLGETNVDVAFLGTNGFSVDGGLTTPDMAEAAVKGAMVACAARRVLLADHSKLGRVAVFRYADLRQIDVLVTDRGMEPAAVRLIEEAGVEVVLA